MRVGGDLERESRQRLRLVGVALDDDGLVPGLEALDGRDVERGRQVVDHSVQQRLDTLVLERGATDHCGEGVGQHAMSNGRLELLDGGLDALEIQLHQFIIMLGDGLDHLSVGRSGRRQHVGRDFLDFVVGAQRGLASVGLGDHLDKVDDPEELRLGTDRQLQQHWRGL